MIFSQSVSFFLPFHGIDAFPPVELLSGHQREDNGHTGRLLVEMMLSRSVCRIRWHGCWWGCFSLFRARWKTTGDGAEGRLLWHSWRSPTCQAVRWLSSHQPTASVINRKGSHVKKKPFQLQPLELQCRTHTYPNTHTHSDTNEYTRAWSESKGWFQWQPEWRTQQDIWHLHCSSHAIILKRNRLSGYSCINFESVFPYISGCV